MEIFYKKFNKFLDDVWKTSYPKNVFFEEAPNQGTVLVNKFQTLY